MLRDKSSQQRAGVTWRENATEGGVNLIRKELCHGWCKMCQRPIKRLRNIVRTASVRNQAPTTANKRKERVCAFFSKMYMHICSICTFADRLTKSGALRGSLYLYALKFSSRELYYVLRWIFKNRQIFVFVHISLLVDIGYVSLQQNAIFARARGAH